MALNPSTDKPVGETALRRFWSNLEGLLSSKQTKLVAGKNITISGNVISANFSETEAIVPQNPSPEPTGNGSIFLKAAQQSAPSFNVLQYYPVGAVFLTSTNKNPSTFLGGTWKLESTGRTLVGCGSGTDDNGTMITFNAGINESDDPQAADANGVYEVTLAPVNLPSHTHTYYRPGGTVNPLSGSGRTTSGLRTSYTTGSTGGSLPHNNCQPSYGIYIWRRTA